MDEDEDDRCTSVGHDEELYDESDGLRTWICRRCDAEWQDEVEADDKPEIIYS